jgi:hypothetical protein
MECGDSRRAKSKDELPFAAQYAPARHNVAPNERAHEHKRERPTQEIQRERIDLTAHGAACDEITRPK